MYLALRHTKLWSWIHFVQYFYRKLMHQPSKKRWSSLNSFSWLTLTPLPKEYTEFCLVWSLLIIQGKKALIKSALIVSANCYLISDAKWWDRCYIVFFFKFPLSEENKSHKRADLIGWARTMKCSIFNLAHLCQHWNDYNYYMYNYNWLPVIC